MSKSNPEQKKSHVSCRICNPDPVHAHLCQASDHNSQDIVDGRIEAGMSTAAPDRSVVLCS